MRQKFEIFRRCLIAAVLLLGACENPVRDGEAALTSPVSQKSRWFLLGENLNPDSTAYVSRPSLSAAPRLEPVLAFSTMDADTGATRTRVSRYLDSGWVGMDPVLEQGGPSVALASTGRAYVCTGGGPFVSRWNGTRWIALGGHIGEETGFKGSRYSVDSCGGIVIDSYDVPIIAWTADVGAKANLVYAARWNEAAGKWEGIGGGNIGGRATDAWLDIDLQDRLYIGAYTPGGSYGGGATTRVWRWDGTAWGQLGADMPNTDTPLVGVYDNSAYLALHDNASGAINIMHWCQNAWVPILSPGHGTLPALGFTLSGKVIVAFLSDDAADAKDPLQMKYFAADAWNSVGATVSEGTKNVTGLAMTVDNRGRPIVGWSEQNISNDRTRVFVSRYNSALP